MARLDLSNYKKVDKQRNSVQERVYWTYTEFDMDGEQYLQIDTYGKQSREIPEKVSQSIQFDRESAKCLVNLLIDKFDLK